LELYTAQKLSAVDIAAKFNCGSTTVYRFMDLHGIKRRNASEAKLLGRQKPSREILEDLYLRQKLSINEISSKTGFEWGTIKQELKTHGFSIRGIGEQQFKLKVSKSEIEDLYVNQKLTLEQIAQKFGLKDSERVRNVLRHYGIERRGTNEGRLIIVDLAPSPELAYVLGVMKGDGSVLGKGTIKLGSIDRIFVDEFEVKLKKIGFNTCYSFWKKSALNSKHKDIHFMQANSIQFVNWYKAQTLEDIQRFLQIPEMQLEFVRGFYESEGHHLKNPETTRCLDFANSNPKLLHLIKVSLEKYGIRSRLYGPYQNKKYPHYKPMYQLSIPNSMAAHFFCGIPALIKFKRNLWEKASLTLIENISENAKLLVGFNENVIFELLSKEQMFSLLSDGAAVFKSHIEGKMKDDIVPFCSANRPFTIYVCLDSLRELTRFLTVEERELFIEGVLIHEFYHGLINDEFKGSKAQEEEWIINMQREKFPVQRKIMEKVLYGK